MRDEATQRVPIAIKGGPDERQCGALIEIGAALAAGKQVFVVSEYEWTVAHHPKCRVFESLETAIAALVAMQAGKSARLERAA